jgi:hypothetical protein
MLRYTTRPISDATWCRQDHQRERSRFTSTWTATLDDLEREYNALNGRHLAIEIDVREVDIRNDGLLRGNAKATSPAVVVAFESKHGPLIYRCDQYNVGPWGYSNKMEVWQHNVRAIALTLEALRAVDRYGATSSGEQYRGFKALPAGTGLAASSMTLSVALETISGYAKVHESVLKERQDLREFTRRAKAETHPDRHDGAQVHWNMVADAIEVLRRAGRSV